jgi:hypothetical protein
MIQQWMPQIAIGGGCVLLFALGCITVWTARRRTPRETPRRTRFHLIAIDLHIARQRRAAFEGELLPAHPTGWELGAPNVTARMRAAKRRDRTSAVCRRIVLRSA